MRLFSLLLAILLFPAAFATAQLSPQFYSFPYNHLDWYTIESDHFLVHFQEGNSRPAQVTSRIAEEIYGPVTELYDYVPDQKINIVLIDRFDFSNGAAYFYDNKIEIWLPSLDTPLRGTHNWLRNVITHELVHIIQLQVSMKQSRRRPASYLQWLSYEDVRRPDVLYGFPSGFISYPFSGISMPAWMAEGTAQFMTENLNYDYWDSHRDMLLRSNILDGTYLSLEKMGTFHSKTSMERELVYNMGFDLTRYISETFGQQAVADVSREFSNRGVFDVRKAIKNVTGIDGREVHRNWIEDRKQQYLEQIAELELSEFEYIEEEGFFNFFPTFHNDNQSIAYLTNRGRHDARLTLVMKDLENNETKTAFHLPRILHHNHSHHGGSCHDDPLNIERVSTSFSFSPDGESLVYSKITQNRYGEEYRDLFLYDIKENESQQLTKSGRIMDPAWHPSEKKVAAVQLYDGSANLVIYDMDADSIQRLTHFEHSEQSYRPVWHPDGNRLYFSYADVSMRGIYEFDIRTGEKQPVLASLHVDYRDPFVSPDGEFLYFSSDFSGIYNIYRMPLLGGDKVQITEVSGGAFMPVVDNEGTLIYSGFTSGGYKIKKHKPSNARVIPFDAEPVVRNQRFDAREIEPLNLFNDANIEPFSELAISVADTGRYQFTLPTRGSSAREFYAYEDQFTSFSFFPVLRFDNYSQPRGSNRSLLRDGKIGRLGENLWRDSKIGVYGSSRSMLENFTLFGGFLIGPGSRDSDGIDDFFRPGRLVSLDRDAFLTLEYTGLPFIQRHWSPTVSLSLFNIRRNVENGLQIEEFPCTACLPDTTFTDIAYDIFQFEASLISKLNRFSLVELGYYHSPYRVSTEPFFSREFREVIAGSTARYFIGNTYTAAYVIEMEEYHRFSAAAMQGLRAQIRYSYEPSRLLDGYDIRDGTLIPVYNNFKNHSVELEAMYGFRIRNEFVSVRGRFFSYFNPLDEYFFVDYIGGFIGMRSYPFFALGGNTTAFAQFNYYTPLITNIYRQYGRITMDNVFLRLFAEAGNGWGGPLNIDNNIKKGLGAELRISMNSYYFFPSRLFISGAYGFDTYTLTFPDTFITPGASPTVSYGGELLINFGLLFDFDF